MKKNEQLKVIQNNSEKFGETQRDLQQVIAICNTLSQFRMIETIQSNQQSFGEISSNNKTIRISKTIQINTEQFRAILSIWSDQKVLKQFIALSNDLKYFSTLISLKLHTPTMSSNEYTPPPEKKRKVAITNPSVATCFFFNISISISDPMCFINIYQNYNQIKQYCSLDSLDSTLKINIGTMSECNVETTFLGNVATILKYHIVTIAIFDDQKRKIQHRVSTFSQRCHNKIIQTGKRLQTTMYSYMSQFGVDLDICI